jgi:ornithine carbamoyltransferase
MMLSPRDTQLGRGEPIKDTARVLARYLDALVVRTFEHEKIEEMARYADVPVVNALTDASHPCQILADLLTITERFGADALSKPGLVVAWIGDGNNMANSWLEACGLLGFELRLACPAGYDPDPALLAKAGSKARIFRSPAEAAEGAHVVNTDVWASMGQEAEVEERRRKFEGFIVDEPLVRRARPNAIVLHCLPAHRG